MARVKLTKGVLARDRVNSKVTARDCFLVFDPGGKKEDIVFRPNGLVRGAVYLWLPDEFRRDYKDVNFTLPRPGGIIEDVYIEL